MNARLGHKGHVVGMRLKAIREKLGFSEEYVAERVGVSARTVANWEVGRAMPKGRRLSALARLYGISVEYLTSTEGVGTVSYRNQYIVIRADGRQDPPEAGHFVLRLDTDPHADAAVSAYARSIRDDNPETADALDQWVRKARSRRAFKFDR